MFDAVQRIRRSPRRVAQPRRLLLCAALAGACWLSAPHQAAAELFLELPTEIDDPPEDVAPAPAVSPADLLRDLKSSDAAKAAKLNQLRDQLGHLRERLQTLESRRNTAPPRAAPVDPHAVPDPLDVPAPAPAPFPEPVGIEPVTPLPHAPHDPESAHSNLSALIASPIVDHPVDRVALGDNLFAVGDAALALQAYEQIDLASLAPNDRYWVQYQIATCHRRLHKYSDAESRYRTLAGESKAGVYATQSKWWLDALTARKGLEADLDRVTSTVQSLTQELNARSPETSPNASPAPAHSPAR